MVLRRELLPLLLAAAFLLVGPAQALAAPTWLTGETQQAVDTAPEPADVAADTDGNATAVWIAGGEVRAAFRPLGGPWEPSENLDPGTPLTQTQPRVTAQPNGDLVAVWLGASTAAGFPLRWAGRTPGGDWSAPDTIGFVSCCPAIGALESDSSGNVTVMPLDEGVGSTFTKAADSQTWGPEQPLPLPEQNPRLALGSDGSAVAVVDTNCGTFEDPDPCLLAAYRPFLGGAWSSPEEAAHASTDQDVSGFDVAARPNGGYTVVWGETTSNEPPSRVRSADRPAGPGQPWGTPQFVADVPFGTVGFSCDNCFDLAAGADGSEVAVWQQSGTSVAGALRDPDGTWSAAQQVGPADGSQSVPFAAITGCCGAPVAAWGATTGGVARASHYAGGMWHTVELSSAGPRGGPPQDAIFLGDIAPDGRGDALTAWRDDGGVVTAGFDATGPLFTALSLPSGGSLTFSATAVDNWSGPPTISWLFGDGTGAGGATLSHAYGSPGTYTATAIATDAVGNAAQQSGPVTVTQTPPPPDPCGTADADKDGIKDACDDSNGAARPRAFKTVNATVVSGEVFVKLPGRASSAQRKPPKGFVRLQGAETIPVGATLDTRHGRVKVRSAATTGRKTQTGQFFRGRFLIRQVRIRKRSKSLITDMRLTGSSFRSTCGANRASVSQTRKRSKKRVRRLFGNAKGRFRTSGRNAAATVRGTRWSVQDRCDGTLVKVQSGRVEVRDKVKRKTLIVRTGRRYLARTR